MHANISDIKCLGNNMYAVSKSKYTGAKSIGMQPVMSSGILSVVSDKSRIMNIEEKFVDIATGWANNFLCI